MAKAIRKAGSKTGAKAEPAATKKGRTTAAPKNTGKKNDTTPAKETETPVPAPDVKLQTRLEILEQSNAELKSELAEAKVIIAKQDAQSLPQKKEISQWKVKAQELEAEAAEWKAKANAYLQPIDNDVQAAKSKVSALPVFWKWLLGIVAFALLVFAAIRAYNNAKDETKHRTMQAEVKALQSQRDSLIEDGRFYKRIAEEQAAQTAYYKKKVQEITGQIEIDNSGHEKERQNDKIKINETKDAIRHAATDSQLIGVLTNTLRQ